MSPPARPRPHLFTAFVLMMGGRVLGAALSPLLLAHAPWALLVVSPVVAHLVLVAGLVPLPAYYALALTIGTAQVVLGYALGRAHGPDALQRLVERGVFRQRTVDALLPLSRRAAPLLLVLLPGPLAATLAGAVGCRPRVFAPVMLASQVAWTVACQVSGAALWRGLAARAAPLGRYALPATLVTVTLALLIYQGRGRWRGRRRRAAAASAGSDPARRRS